MKKTYKPINMEKTDAEAIRTASLSYMNRQQIIVIDMRVQIDVCIVAGSNRGI